MTRNCRTCCGYGQGESRSGTPLRCRPYLRQARGIGAGECAKPPALAKCLYQGGQEEAAQITFERALQLEPDNAIASANLKAISEGEPAASVEPPVEAAPSPSDETALRELLQWAQNALEADKPDEAITPLENLLSQRPNEVELLNALGNLYMGQGKPAVALEYFRRNADLRAEDVMPQLQAATTALLARDYDVFEAHMQRVLKIEPGHPHGLKLLATANFRAQDFAQAAQLYEQAVLDLKEDMEVILAWAYVSSVCKSSMKPRAGSVARWRLILTTPLPPRTSRPWNKQSQSRGSSATGTGHRARQSRGGCHGSAAVEK